MKYETYSDNRRTILAFAIPITFQADFVIYSTEVSIRVDADDVADWEWSELVIRSAYPLTGGTALTNEGDVFEAFRKRKIKLDRHRYAAEAAIARVVTHHKWSRRRAEDKARALIDA